MSAVELVDAAGEAAATTKQKPRIVCAAVGWSERVVHATAASSDPQAGPGDAHTICGVDIYGGDLDRKLPIGWWNAPVAASVISCKRCLRSLGLD